MAKANVIKASLALRNINYSEIASLAKVSKRMVEYHIAGSSFSEAIDKVLNELIGKEIQYLEQFEEQRVNDEQNDNYQKK